MTIKYVAVIVSKNGRVLHKGDACPTDEQAVAMAVLSYTQAKRFGGVATKTGRLGEAVAFIKTELRDGWKSAADMNRNAEAAGLSLGTVRRAREKMGVVVKRGVGSQAAPWFWSLPN